MISCPQLMVTMFMKSGIGNQSLQAGHSRPWSARGSSPMMSRRNRDIYSDSERTNRVFILDVIGFGTAEMQVARPWSGQSGPLSFV
jgi:hypothetical protein